MFELFILLLETDFLLFLKVKSKITQRKLKITGIKILLSYVKARARPDVTPCLILNHGLIFLRYIEHIFFHIERLKASTKVNVFLS